MSHKYIPYPGQKKINGVYQAIINLIPPVTDFYELFAGSAQLSKILLSINPELKIHLNDLSTAVIDKYSFASAICTTQNAMDIIDNLSYERSDNKIIFLDPPYLHSTRPNNTNLYEFEMSDEDHFKLFMSITAAKTKIILIHPVCEFYDRLIGLGWSYRDIKIRYNKKTSIERIYINYGLPTKLLTYRFLGKNFTDRQRILRKCERFSQKLLLLPEIERNCIISYIVNDFSL